MYRLLNDLLQPYTFVLLTMAASLVLVVLNRQRRKAWYIFTAAFVAMWLLSLPATSHLAFLSLESQTQPCGQLPEGIDTIVVLAGGILPRTPNQLRPGLADDSIYRCLMAAYLCRTGDHPWIILSGGVVDPDGDAPAAAELMREFTVQLGLDATRLVVEDRSTSTYENARSCKSLLDERGLQNIVLVTDASHMPRAAACFRKAGLQVTEAPAHFVTEPFEWRLAMFLPSAAAARGNERVFHEWLGMIWYWLHGRI